MKVSNHDAISAGECEWELIPFNFHFPSTVPVFKYSLPVIVYADGECYTMNEETRDHGRFVPYSTIVGQIYTFMRAMFGGLPCYQNLDRLRFHSHVHNAVRRAISLRSRGEGAGVEVDLRRADPDDIVAVVRTLTSAGV